MSVVAWIGLVFASLFIALDIGCVVASYRTRCHISMVFPFPGLIALWACCVLPIGWRLGLIALVIDPCCAPTAVLAVVAVVRWLARRARA